MSEQGEKLGLTGWVKNLSDGRVESVIEGEKALIEELIDWCKNSQPYAMVSEVDLIWEKELEDFQAFFIRR